MTVAGLLAEAVERASDRPALVVGDGDLTYGQLDEAAGVLASRLAERCGELEGARIAVIAPNVPALVAAAFAAWRSRAVAVPLSARLREHELRQILADAEPAAVVSVESYLGFSFVELLGGLVPELPSVRSCLFVRGDGAIVGEVDGPGSTRPEPLADEFAAVLYTSGTTGVPKGALVRHARERETAPRLAELLSLGPSDRVALVVPISHAYGLACYLATVAAGAAAILVESTFSPGPLLDAVAGGGASVLHGSPALFASVLKARPDGLPGIRVGFVAGASSPPRLLEQLDERGLLVLNLYGLTEAGAVSCCRPEDPLERRLTTVGRLLPTYEARLGEGGRLELRGPYVTPGYFRRPEEDAEAFAGDWFRTGDLATLDDGYLSIVGRAKDIVHVGGFNVVPAEVEAVLLEHPDIAQAAVVGVPSEQMGEALRAYVVARPGSALAPADVVRFARSRIAGYKVPYAVSILPQLPLLASGKPDRRVLAAVSSDR